MFPFPTSFVKAVIKVLNKLICCQATHFYISTLPIARAGIFNFFSDKVLAGFKELDIHLRYPELACFIYLFIYVCPKKVLVFITSDIFLYEVEV